MYKCKIGDEGSQNKSFIFKFRIFRMFARIEETFRIYIYILVFNCNSCTLLNFLTDLLIYY
jgi:hypothetical protein